MRGYDVDGIYLGGYHIPLRRGKAASFVPAARDKGKKWAGRTETERVAELTTRWHEQGNDNLFVLTIDGACTPYQLNITLTQKTEATKLWTGPKSDDVEVEGNTGGNNAPRAETSDEDQKN